ncbi:MAG: hypothetical protein M1819_006845 [Sarea resinae]|nr:MAG: hypothetical protein M1819_006845 [Sarea resinae]
MRFKASIKNISTFTKFTASLSSLGKVAWVRFDENEVRFTIIPEVGTQDTIFESYTIQSAAPSNAINLELPVAPLHRALRSALSASSASLRLTKKDDIPLLSLTVVADTVGSGHGRGGSGGGGGGGFPTSNTHNPSFGRDEDGGNNDDGGDINIDFSRDRETLITQDIPIRVLAPASVAGIHEPRCREPDVHILLPPLLQLKAISERFTRLASSTSSGGDSGGGGGSRSAGAGLSGAGSGSNNAPTLTLAATMHGHLRLSLTTPHLTIASTYTNLTNPTLVLPTDPESEPDENAPFSPTSSSVPRNANAEANANEKTPQPPHPSALKAAHHPSDPDPESAAASWSSVRIDARDWGRVLSVGRMGGRVVACFVDGWALVLKP